MKCLPSRNSIVAIYLAGAFLPGPTFAAVFLSTLVTLCVCGVMYLHKLPVKF